MQRKYSFLDCGDGQRLERFGDYVIARPCAQAIWRPRLDKGVWAKADAVFTREGGNQWKGAGGLPASWTVEVAGLLFKLAATDFGHLGIFPEHHYFWEWMVPLIQRAAAPVRVLNLFAYSGGATLAAARAGAQVCHLDASKGMVAWARENATLNGMQKAPIRWITDDVLKFLRRELKRGSFYEGIILDPPTFGRGNQGEVFKIERDLDEILSLCRSLLSERSLFLILSSHTPGMTPVVMRQLMQQTMEKGKIYRNNLKNREFGKEAPQNSRLERATIAYRQGASENFEGKPTLPKTDSSGCFGIEAAELVLSSEEGWKLPCGSFATWSGDGRD